jgi:glutathione S-transferase
MAASGPALHPARAMKLYMHPGSPNSRRARAAARLAEADVEEVLVDVARGENRTRDYLALNPMGKVPTLVADDGRVILESYAIGVELGRSTSLLPDDRLPEVLRWQFFDACHFARPLGTLTYEHLFAKVPDKNNVAAALEDWRRYAAVVEAALERGPYLVPGDKPTLADVALAASLTYGDKSGVPLADFPNLAQWRTTLESLPAFTDTRPPQR